MVNFFFFFSSKIFFVCQIIFENPRGSEKKNFEIFTDLSREKNKIQRAMPFPKIDFFFKVVLNQIEKFKTIEWLE
jgi:hypothetical protein